MKKIENLHKTLSWLFVIILFVLFFSESLYSQTDSINDFKKSGRLALKVAKPKLKLETNEIISNVLFIVNISQDSINFNLRNLLPNNWVDLAEKDNTYKIRPRDTLIIPIYIKPNKTLSEKANTFVNCLLVDNESGNQIGNITFNVFVERREDWILKIGNTRDFYFKNEEDSLKFSLGIENRGNYSQDLLLNLNLPRNDLQVKDSLGEIATRKNYQYKIKANSEEIHDFIVTAKGLDNRNKERVSIINYDPTQISNRFNRSLIFNSNSLSTTSNTSKNLKANFIKLPNKIKFNNDRADALPLIVELNAQNILETRSFLSLNLQGYKAINNEASIAYFTQLNYSNSFFSNQVFNNVPWYVGYYDNKRTFELGQVSHNFFGVQSFGKGFKSSFKLNSKHSIGAILTSSAGFLDFANTNLTYGAWHDYYINENFEVNTSFAYNSNFFNDVNRWVATFRPRIRINKNHNLNVITGFSNSSLSNNQDSNNGYLLGFNYGSYLFNKKLRSNINLRYNDSGFTSNFIERFILNWRNNYDISKSWNLLFAGNYQYSNMISQFNGFSNRFEILNSSLLFNKVAPNGNLQPGIFYNINRSILNDFEIRGLSFRYSINNFEKNLLASFLTRAGYAKPRNLQVKKEYFNFDFSSFLRFRAWNFNFRYSLGRFYNLINQQNINDLITPQSFRSSIQNQYLFKNRHLVLESTLAYNYINLSKNHQLNVIPRLFYFNNTGWRFGIGANFNFYSSNYENVFLIPDYQNFNQNFSTSTVNFSFNLRKEFDIPIPFIKRDSKNIQFFAFTDVNGNYEKDENETTVGDVVLKINNKEVLTNPDGVAVVENIGYGKYKIEVLPLIKNNGWFPNVADSIVISSDNTIQIPFARGVKLTGEIILDNQKIGLSSDLLKLSGIKITATTGENVYNTLTNKQGEFSFYLPFGNFTLSINEDILPANYFLTENNIKINLNKSVNNVYTAFYIVEKRRKVIIKDFTKE